MLHLKADTVMVENQLGAIEQLYLVASFTK